MTITKNVIVFTNNGKSKNAVRSKMISNLNKAEKLLTSTNFKNLQKDLILNLKSNNSIVVNIDKNNYFINIEQNAGGFFDFFTGTPSTTPQPTETPTTPTVNSQVPTNKNDTNDSNDSNDSNIHSPVSTDTFTVETPTKPLISTSVTTDTDTDTNTSISSTEETSTIPTDSPSSTPINPQVSTIETPITPSPSLRPINPQISTIETPTTPLPSSTPIETIGGSITTETKNNEQSGFFASLFAGGNKDESDDDSVTNGQTSFFNNDDTNSDDEEPIYTRKSLNNYNIPQLKSLMKTNSLTMSNRGKPLNKKQMISKLLKK